MSSTPNFYSIITKHRDCKSQNLNKKKSSQFLRMFYAGYIRQRNSQLLRYVGNSVGFEASSE